MPSTSDGRSPASFSALRTASTAMARVVRPELCEYSVSPTPTMQYLSRREFIRSPFASRGCGARERLDHSAARSHALAVELREDLRQELSRVGARGLRDDLGRTFGDDLAALVSGLGTEVDHVIGGLD